MGAIAASKTRPLPNVLFGLGIRFVGGTVARLLSEHFGSLAAVMSATKEELESVAGIGPEIASSVVSWSSRQSNRDLVRELDELGLTFEHTEERAPNANSELPLTNARFVLTGTLETLRRSEAEQMIRDAGGSVSSSVSSRTTHVLVGASPGSKAERARQLGVAIGDEKQFLEILNSRLNEPEEA